MIINNRFEVNRSRSEVFDRETKKLVHLESRLMKLLCILVENKEQVVTRELIIKEIWDDYPGAGEGLNQSISVLRKILGDQTKQLIETLPKTGYCFHGSIEKSQISNKVKPSLLFYAFTVILILTVAFFLGGYYHSGKESTYNDSDEEARQISKIDSTRQAERLKEAPKSDHAH